MTKQDAALFKFLDQIRTTGISPGELPSLVIRQAMAAADLESNLGALMDGRWAATKDADPTGILSELAVSLRLREGRSAVDALSALDAITYSSHRHGWGMPWVSAIAADQLASFASDASSVRFSYDLALHPALRTACVAKDAGKACATELHAAHAEIVAAANDLARLWDLDLSAHRGRSIEADTRYDVEIALPPFGMRMEPEALDLVPARTLHFLAAAGGQARVSVEALAVAEATLRSRRAIVCVSNGLLFRTVGAEARLREELVRLGRLEGVVALPSGALMSDTMVRLSLMILSSSDGTPTPIRMADFSGEPFSHAGVRGRRELNPEISWRASFEGGSELSPNTVAEVSPDEVAANNFVLNPERYLAAPEGKELQALLDMVPTARLDALVEFVRARALRKVDNGSFKAREAAPGDFGPDGFLKEPERVAPLDESGYRMAREQQLRPGDILISIKGTVGLVALVPEGVPDMGAEEIWTAGQSIMVMRVRREAPVDRVTLFSYLATPTARAYLQALAGGTTIMAINAKDLRALPVPVPSKALQIEINELRRCIDLKFSEIETIKNRIYEYENSIESVLTSKEAYDV